MGTKPLAPGVCCTEELQNSCPWLCFCDAGFHCWGLLRAYKTKVSTQYMPRRALKRTNELDNKMGKRTGQTPRLRHLPHACFWGWPESISCLGVTGDVSPALLIFRSSPEGGCGFLLVWSHWGLYFPPLCFSSARGPDPRPFSAQAPTALSLSQGRAWAPPRWDG